MGVGKLEQRELFDTLTRDAAAMMQTRACAFYLHDPGSASLRNPPVNSSA